MAKKVNIYGLDGEPLRSIKLPEIFDTPYRPDLIKRAVLSSRAARIQPYGVNKNAGMRTTAESRGPGMGIARVPRVKGSRYSAAMRGALAPMTVGGRRAHPPKPEKKYAEKINKKERRMAICSAIAATAQPELVKQRGHKIENLPEMPLIVSDEFQSINVTSETRDFFIKLGVWPDILRAKKGKKIRSGKGKMRGRKYKKPKSILVVIGEDRGIVKASRNHPGLDIVNVRNLNAELLAPGTIPGRLTVWTESALTQLQNLFAL
ncbi:MAG: 50S ribosomal protein L4 [Candidatus Jordarchaeum sp.]|uniref:50S ribosomal protein L4 n=1 Tax=Candidatus Jordarchaeum sp. TaxID=2823881 RepID=UPI00404B8A8C